MTPALQVAVDELLEAAEQAVINAEWNAPRIRRLAQATEAYRRALPGDEHPSNTVDAQCSGVLSGAFQGGALGCSSAGRDATLDPLRTRPDYDFRCQRCGAPHNIDTSIPSAAWNAIVERDSPGGDKYGALCTLCIDDLLVEKGLTAKAEFYFGGRGLTGKGYAESQGEVEWLQRELTAVKECLSDLTLAASVYLGEREAEGKHRARVRLHEALAAAVLLTDPSAGGAGGGASRPDAPGIPDHDQGSLREAPPAAPTTDEMHQGGNDQPWEAGTHAPADWACAVLEDDPPRSERDGSATGEIAPRADARTNTRPPGQPPLTADVPGGAQHAGPAGPSLALYAGTGAVPQADGADGRFTDIELPAVDLARQAERV